MNVKMESQEAMERGMFGVTPLRGAVANGHRETAELLIAKGLHVNAKSDDGGTPLHDAAAEGYKGVAELFIIKGADVIAMINKGKTPLDWAIEEGHKETADLLRKNGAKTGEKLKTAGN